jgi:signal recognition particle receptor subunit beta
MVFFNYATMQMAAKIVYYGPGLCGKTTNLHVIYGRTAPSSRGEMVCLETETDRTLFFDLLPLDVGVIGGFKTRLQLYTVPGQVFYNTTRKLVLKGVDGIVFVADSQRPMLEPNRESLRNLGDNLAEIGISLDAIPRVLQYNKRDLASILTVDELNGALNPDRQTEWYEASATNGTGVFETLKAISKLTLRSLRGRMTADAKRPTVIASAPTPAPGPISTSSSSPGRPLLDDIVPTTTTVVQALPPPEPPQGRTDSDSMLHRLNRFREFASGVATAAPAPLPVRTPATASAAPPPPAAPAASFPALSPGAQAPPPAAAQLAEMPPGAMASPFPEAAPGDESAADEFADAISGDITLSDVSFAEIPQPSAPEPLQEQAMKHVRVRSSVDIFSELEKLRKRSTQRPVGRTDGLPSDSGLRRRTSDFSIDDLLIGALNHRKDVSQAFDVSIPKDALTRSHKVTIGLSFEGNPGEDVLSRQTFSLELTSLKDVQKLLLSLKFNIRGD